MLLGIAGMLDGCASGPTFFKVDRGLALSKGGSVVRTPVGFGALRVPERVQAEIIAMTDERLGPRWSKMVALNITPPDKFRRAEERANVGGYFDPRTGQFDWNRYKKVLDAMNATAVLEVGYGQGLTNISYTEFRQHVTETVASVELVATLKDAESGAVLYEWSRAIYPLKGYAHEVKSGLGGALSFLGKNLMGVTDFTPEQVWNAKRKLFERQLDVLAKQMEKDFGEGGVHAAQPSTPVEEEGAEPQSQMPESQEQETPAPVARARPRPAAADSDAPPEASPAAAPDGAGAEKEGVSAKRLVKEGRAALKVRDFDTAIEKFAEVVQIEPKCATYFLLGYSHHRRGFKTRDPGAADISDVRETVRAYSQAMALDPGLSALTHLKEFYQSLALSYEALADFKKAPAAYKKAIEADPNNPMLHLFAARLRHRMGDARKASANLALGLKKAKKTGKAKALIEMLKTDSSFSTLMSVAKNLKIIERAESKLVETAEGGD